MNIYFNVASLFPGNVHGIELRTVEDMGKGGVNKPRKSGDVIYVCTYVSLEILITGFVSKISSNLNLVYYLHE